MKKILISLLLMLINTTIIGQVNNISTYKINSKSNKFAEAELGRNAKFFGTFKESESGDDSWYETKNKIILETKENDKIGKIIFECQKLIRSKGDASIDGVTCDDNENIIKNKVIKFKELCTTEELKIIIYYIVVNKAFFLVENNNGKGKILSMGLVDDPKLLSNRHEDPYIDCSEARKLISQARQQKFSSVSEMNKAQEKINSSQVKSNKIGLPPEVKEASECSAVTVSQSIMMKQRGDNDAYEKLAKNGVTFGKLAVQLALKQGILEEGVILNNKEEFKKLSDLISNSNRQNSTDLYSSYVSNKMNSCISYLKSNSEIRNLYQNIYNQNYNQPKINSSNNSFGNLILTLHRLEGTSSVSMCTLHWQATNNTNLNITDLSTTVVFKETDGTIIGTNYLNFKRIKKSDSSETQTYSTNSKCSDIKNIKIKPLELLLVDGNSVQSNVITMLNDSVIANSRVQGLRVDH